MSMATGHPLRQEETVDAVFVGCDASLEQVLEKKKACMRRVLFTLGYCERCTCLHVIHVYTEIRNIELHYSSFVCLYL